MFRRFLTNRTVTAATAAVSAAVVLGGASQYRVFAAPNSNEATTAAADLSKINVIAKQETTATGNSSNNIVNNTVAASEAATDKKNESSHEKKKNCPACMFLKTMDSRKRPPIEDGAAATGATSSSNDNNKSSSNSNDTASSSNNSQDNKNNIRSTTDIVADADKKNINNTSGYVNEEFIDEAPGLSELGHSTWTALHSIAAYYSKKPSEVNQQHALNLVRAVSVLFPCTECGEHFQQLIVQRPPTVKSRDEFEQWLCWAHNEVNKVTGKPQFDCSKAHARWCPGEWEEEE